MASIEITTNVGCTLACKFCPQDKISKIYKSGPERMMTFEDFKIILSKIPKNVRIDFSGYSEPFLNPLAIKFVQHTASLGYQQSIYTTLTGVSYESASILLQLLDARKITKLVVHLPDAHNNMPGFKFDNDYLVCLKNLLKSKYVSCMTMSKTNEIPNDIINYIKKESPRNIFKKLPINSQQKGFVGWRRGNSLDTSKIDTQYLLPIVRWSKPISCASSPFYNSNVVMPNGNVHLCCMDYGGRHILGNLLNNEYINIFKSQEMQKIIVINMQDKFSEETICRKCEDVLVHEFDYNNHGWSSFRPGHIISAFDDFNINDSQKKSIVNIIRSLINVKKEFVKLLFNKKND